MNINEFKENFEDMKTFNNKQFLKCASSIEKLVKLNSLCFDYCYYDSIYQSKFYNKNGGSYCEFLSIFHSWEA